MPRGGSGAAPGARSGAGTSRAAAGIRGRHYVVNTSQNGVPFLAGQYPGNNENPRVHQLTGPPVRDPRNPADWQVAGPRWRLPARARRVASRYADAYLWIGRPWLDDGSEPFDLARALGLARSTPF